MVLHKTFSLKTRERMAAALLSSYEMERLENIRRNEEYMESIGLGTAKSVMAVRPKRRQASQRGKKRREVDASELRRSTRLRGGEDLVSLPANFKEPTIDARMPMFSPAPRVDVEVEIDEVLLECFSPPPPSNKQKRSAAVVTPVQSTYEESLRSLRLAERDVAKVTAGGKGFSLAFYPSPRKLVVATGDSQGHIGVWDVEDDDDERCAREFVGHHTRPIAALAWQGDDLWSCGYDSLARKLSFEKGASVIVADYVDIEDVGDLIHAALDGDKIYGAHGDGALSLIDTRVAKDKLAWSLTAHSAKAAHVAVKDHEVATAGNDGAVKIWDVRTRKKRWEATHQKSVRGCAWSPDGAMLCSVSYDNTLKIFDSKALKSTKAAVTSCLKIFHDNRTGRYLTPFKPTFDPHAPTPVVVLGSMESPRRIDLISATPDPAVVKLGDTHTNKLKNCLVNQLHDNGDVFRAVTSINDVHPVHHVIAGINNSSRVSIWRRRQPRD